MHGKIAIYMDSTGRGTVTNSANTFFDFNRQIWNDKKKYAKCWHACGI